MDETGLIERLILFGLTRQEAMIYLCLVQSGELTGYEVSKQTGISRSNAYSALAGLTSKGATCLIEGTSAKYVAVPAEEFCTNRIRLLEDEKKYLLKNMPIEKCSQEGYITIEGYRHIMDKIHNMLQSATMRVYFSASGSIIKKFEKELLELEKKEVKVVLITNETLKVAENPGIVLYKKYTVEDVTAPVPVRLIIDSSKVLTGEVAESVTDTCLYSAHKNFVNLFKEAMGNEIKLIELTEK